MKKYSKIIVIVVSVLLLGLVGITYGFFNYTRTGQNSKVIAGSLYLTLNEGNDTINITNALPQTKEEARSKTGNTLTFTIKGKNTSTTKNINYEIILNNGAENANVQKQRIHSKDLVFDLIEIGPNNEETYVLDAVSYNTLNNQRIWVDKVNKNTTSEIERTYKLRVWVSDNIIVSDSASNADYTTTEYKNLYASVKVIVEGDVEEKYKCKRATVLHTETCTQSSNYCYADGYTANGSKGTTTITYGNTSVTNGELHTGDAFDCDVNGDGEVNVYGNGNSTERFYYVSRYYDTNANPPAFDNTTATLIYYSNTYNNGSSVVASTNGAAYYASAQENWHGPVTAATHLPSTTQWSNIRLKNISRTILACDNANCSNTPVLTTSGGTISNPFSYTGKAARLLTLMELANGCKTINNNTSVADIGSLAACNFLFEGTKYADNNNAITGPWLETPLASSSSTVWYASASSRYVLYNYVGYTDYGARPAIDVPISQLKY